MTIQYASDLHLEMTDNKYFLQDEPLQPVGDLLLLAGDIAPFRFIKEYDWFFDYISNNFKTTYWIPGNHEYYHYDLASKCGSFNEAIRDNIFLVNDYAVTVENARMIFSTLWTSIRPRNQIAIERGMNDFHLIRNKGVRLTADDLREYNERSVGFIHNELTGSPVDLKKIVVTHHVPTFINYPPQYLGDALNEAFAVELKTLIRNTSADYWLYGHHHQNIAEFKVGNTTLITNQLGYVRYNENESFDNEKVLII